MCLFSAYHAQSHLSGIVCLFCRKSERKINFQQFKDALQYLADKKYPSERESLAVLTARIMDGKGPSISGTTVCDPNTTKWL